MPEIVRRNVDPQVAHLRARVGWLRRDGRHDEADVESRNLRARLLLLTVRHTVAESPLPLQTEQVDAIVAALRGAA